MRPLEFATSNETSVVGHSVIPMQYYAYRKSDSSRNIHTHCDIRPRKVLNSPFNPKRSSEKLFHDRRTFPDECRKNGLVDFCLDLEWGNSASEYCENSTLHGLKYVGDGKLSLFERFFWGVSFISGVLAAAYFITILYSRWNDNPMIISLSSKATHLETIPFPAVTICNMNGAKKSVAEFVERHLSNDSKTLFEKHMVKKLCNPTEKTYQSSKQVNASWNKMQNFMIKVSQSCHTMLVSCKWRGEVLSCQDIFNPEITDEGMCCSFNKVERGFIYRNPRQLHGLNYTFPYPAIDWTPENGYPPDAPLNANPWRAFGAGMGLGLSIVLDAELFDYYCSSTSSVGFKLLLHSPVETPKISEFAYFIMPGKETRVEITPKISTTTSSLIYLPENQRNCVFSVERNLRFYRTYTQRNCELECQSNYTLMQCNCVPFYLPKDVTTRICGTADDECVDLVKGLIERRLHDDVKNQTNLGAQKEIRCSCLPSCVQIFYTKQMSTSELYNDINADMDPVKDPVYFKKNMAVVHFFFIENSFTSFEKGEIFGFTDFLSSTGGLLGLFLGFSFMSAAEIVYFMTVKVFCTRLRKHKKTVNMTELPFAK